MHFPGPGGIIFDSSLDEEVSEQIARCTKTKAGKGHSPPPSHDLEPLQMRPLCRETLGDLELTRLETIADIGEVRRPSNHIRHAWRHPLIQEGELLHRLWHGEARGKLADQVHPPGRVTNVLIISDVLSKILAPAFDYERLDVLMAIGMSERTVRREKKAADKGK